MESKKLIQTNYLQNRNRLTGLENKLVVAGVRERGKGIAREFGMDMYTLLHLKWVTNKGLLYNIGNSAQCYVAGWMGGKFEGEWIHAYA